MGITVWFWHLVLALSRAWTAIRLSIRLESKDRWPDGPLLVCAKHSSGLDIPILAWLSWKLRKARPHFQMGAFVGYPVLGRLVPFMKRLGGFPVLRPKEARRLVSRKGLSREEAVSVMERMNEEAERFRRGVLHASGLLVVFPEGTRNDREIGPLRARTEFASAHAAADAGAPVTVLPVMMVFGPKRFFRRRVRISVLPAIPLDPGGPEETRRKVEEAFRLAWGASPSGLRTA